MFIERPAIDFSKLRRSGMSTFRSYGACTHLLTFIYKHSAPTELGISKHALSSVILKSQWRDLTDRLPQRHGDTSLFFSVSLHLCGQFSFVELTSLTSDSHKTLPALTPPST